MAESQLRLRPEELLTFIELRSFTTSWNELRLDSDDLLDLQVTILRDPSAPPIVKGTGGLRKMRFSPSRWKRGKSGALRVGYVYFEKFKTVLLALVYAKNEQDDLDQAEKNQIKALIARIQSDLERRATC